MGNRYHIYANDDVDEKLSEIKPILKQKYGDNWKSKLWKFGIERFAEEYQDVEKRIEEKESQIEELVEELKTLKQHSIERERREMKKEKKERLQELKNKKRRLEQFEGMSESELRDYFRDEYLENVIGEPDEEQVESYVERKVDSALDDKEELSRIEDEIGDLKDDLKEIENGENQLEVSEIIGEGGLLGSV